MPLDLKALSQALAKTAQASPKGLDTLHSALCRREAPAFQRAAKSSAASGDALLVACTQEQRLFLELNEQTEGTASVEERPIHFVNIRETGGWSRDASEATPKIAALIAAAQAPAPQPVTTVSYRSGGRCLVIGDAQAAEQATAMLTDKLDVSLLVQGGALPQAHERAVHMGQLQSLRGWLGAFEAEWESGNPIDLDLCTRCNGCIDACPEKAIDFSYQVLLDLCKDHRDCVRVCDAAGAIDFSRTPRIDAAAFDLVLDLRANAAFTMHQKPQGYFHVGDDAQALMKAVLELREAVGDFEKPKFFNYQPKLCAHSRNEQIGCRACIDVCSAQAIRSDASLKGKATVRGLRRPATPAVPMPSGGGIVVEPHLCVGCGACSTVCPSGALSFAYPGPADQGLRIRAMLTAYAAAGGRDAALLLHSEGAGAKAIGALGRAASIDKARRGVPAGIDKAVRGVPARVLPLALWHTASVGLDLWLAALAQGASQVWVLLSDEEAPEYRQALAAQMAVAQSIVSGLGYRGEHFRLIDLPAAGDPHALDALLTAAPAQTVARAGSFATQADKRATLDLAIDHLLAQAPQPADDITLPAAGAPFGSLQIDAERCTMCLSCVGACPQSALADNADWPELRFIESNCVQCGLCATTCPESAISLQPRLWLADGGKARKALRVINRMEPYRCVRCAAPFGTLRAVENMIGKLAGHSAFQGRAAERLKMCGDCRVIDLHRNPDEVRITDLPR
jgi:ferredoxin